MKNSRKIIAGLATAAALATAGAIAYADPEVSGPGWGECFYGAAGAGPMGGYYSGMGPGMMGNGGWGPHRGYGPGMMGYGGGPRSGYGPGMMGYGGGYGPGAAAGTGIVERMDAQLSFLKDQIKITSKQQAAWDAYATQAKAQAATMQAFHSQPFPAAETAAERAEQHADRAKLRAEQMKAMSAAVKDLYAALTPEQKAVADRYFGGPRLSQRGPRGYGR